MALSERVWGGRESGVVGERVAHLADPREERGAEGEHGAHKHGANKHRERPEETDSAVVSGLRMRRTWSAPRLERKLDGAISMVPQWISQRCRTPSGRAAR